MPRENLGRAMDVRADEGESTFGAMPSPLDQGEGLVGSPSDERSRGRRLYVSEVVPTRSRPTFSGGSNDRVLKLSEKLTDAVTGGRLAHRCLDFASSRAARNESPAPTMMKRPPEFTPTR